MNYVDEINNFRSRPWGHISCETVYNNIDNALNQKDEKYKNDRLKDPSHNIEKYNLYDFTFGV